MENLKQNKKKEPVCIFCICRICSGLLKKKGTIKLHGKFPKYSFLYNNKAHEFQFCIIVDVYISKSSVKGQREKAVQ